MDLTYPDGHAKAGEPLDKVCIIGQSGTGKTSLLNLMKSYMVPQDHWSANSPKDYLHSVEIEMGRHRKLLFRESGDPDILSYSDTRFSQDSTEDIFYSENYKPWMLFFPAETIEQVSQVIAEDTDNPLDLFATNGQLEKRFQERVAALSKKAVYDFSTHDSKDAWDAVLLKARAYRDQEIKYRLNISNLALGEEPQELMQAKLAFNSWLEKNPSPFNALASSLDPLLENFQVHIKTELDYERAEDLRFIQLQTQADKDIPFAAWSTGTKQIVLTATPIFNTNTQFTTILMDEPERSLYPDIQRIIVDYYQEIGDGAQFIFATHSPFIAANFAPWEVFELEFDEDGYSQVVPYYTGKRQVSNYKNDPRYQRWDHISKKHFGVKTEGNPLRKEKLQELSRLEHQIRDIRAKENPDKAEWQKLWDAYKKAAELLDWDLDS